MIRIKFENVSKKYNLINTGGIKTFIFNLYKQIKEYKENEFVALHDISFEIKDKEVVGIIGRNGAGKSTTLGLIAQVLSPSSGTVEVSGKIAPLLELGAGFHQDLTGRENILLNGLLLGLKKSEIQKEINNIIEFAEIEEFIDQPVRMYSSGMMARLGFSIAIKTNPDILLIDEVLSVGDSSFQSKSKKKIFEFKEKGITIVFVSHDINSIAELCDKVIWIDNHEIKKIGTPNQVIPEYSSFFE